MGSPMTGNSRVAPLRRSGMSIATLFVSSDSAPVMQSGTVPSPVQQSGSCRPCSPPDDDATQPRTPECVGGGSAPRVAPRAQDAAAPDSELGGPQIYAIRVASRKPHGRLLQCNLMLRAPRYEDWG